MTLSEVYFFILIIFIQLFSVFIISTTEDLKQTSYYTNYLKLTSALVLIGILMELLDWNHLCRFQCILLTSSPFITLNLAKGTAYFFQKAFRKTPFQTFRHQLSDGFYIENKGDIEQINYYNFYSIVLSALPPIIIFGLFLTLEIIIC